MGFFLYEYVLITLFPNGMPSYITLDEYTLRDSSSGHRKSDFPTRPPITLLSSAVETQAILPLLQPNQCQAARREVVFIQVARHTLFPLIGTQIAYPSRCIPQDQYCQCGHTLRGACTCRRIRQIDSPGLHTTLPRVGRTFI